MAMLAGQRAVFAAVEDLDTLPKELPCQRVVRIGAESNRAGSPRPPEPKEEDVGRAANEDVPEESDEPPQRL